MSEIDKSCDISVLIFFDFWHLLSNAKSIIRFCKKHFTQLIKLTDIFNLINILTSCFNATWSKTSLTSKSKQISVFSQLFVICVFDVKSIKKDEKWHKIVIHSLKIEIFNMKTEMKNLKTKLKFFNIALQAKWASAKHDIQWWFFLFLH